MTENKENNFEELKRYKITTEDGYDVASGYITTEEMLKALGIKIPKVTEASRYPIKYEPLLFISGKTTDFIVFMKYKLTENKITADLTIRIRYGDEKLDFNISDIYTTKKIYATIKKALYRFAKIKNANRSRDYKRLEKAFDTLHGDVQHNVK